MKKQSNLSRLLKIAGSHKYLLYASWVLSAVSAFIALVPFYYIWKVIRDVLDAAPDFGQAENLPRNGWMAVLFSVIAVLIYISGLMCSHKGAFRVATNLRLRTMEHIVKLPLGFAESFGSGRLRKIVNESSAATETYLAHQLPDRYNAIATPCGLLILLLVFDWRLGLLSLVPVVLGFLIMMAMTGRRMQEKMKEYQDALDDMSNEAVEYVRGIPVVKTFGQTIFSFKKFKDSIDRYKVWVIAYTKALRLPMMFYTTAINGVFAFLIAGGIVLTGNGVEREVLLNLIFYIIITPVIGTTLTKIMFMSEDSMIVEDALGRIDGLLGEKPLPESRSCREPENESVRLEHVTYSYDGRKNALEDVSLFIPAGQRAAFVGPSGGGKTTLASLTARFFDPQKGKVEIGGVDLRNISKERLMEQISFVFQNSRLFKASILENVRAARPNASREQVLSALTAAQCGDIIEKLPDGVDTQIGTEGTYLSGGEQQRIALARAILKDAPIVVLDEATAFADPENEVLIQKAFAALTKGRTVIMIAHRLSTVVGADKIIVLDDGQIAEQGTHEALVGAGGLYAQMWADYNRSVEWKISGKKEAE